MSGSLKLTPPHGWNAVVWDLAIVTVGVLIALGAQQFVDDFHWRGEVRDFRKAVRAGSISTSTRRREQWLLRRDAKAN
jgi:hypothetical protein